MRLAEFKAKYAISNFKASSLFINYSSPREIKEWVENNNEPSEITKQIHSMDAFAEHLIKESEITGAGLSYAQVLKHDVEVLRKEIYRVSIDLEVTEDILISYRRMNFIERLKFLFSPQSKNNRIVYKEPRYEKTSQASKEQPPETAHKKLQAEN